MTMEKVDLNRANASDLDKIKGIGPVVSNLIVNFRNEHGPFKSWDDVGKIPGFKTRMVEQVKAGSYISPEEK